MTRIACIGDCLTWGFTLVDPWRQSYPALLGEMLGPAYEVRNFGCNGASVGFDADLPYVRTQAYRASLAWSPDVVLLMLGSNDANPRDWDAGPAADPAAATATAAFRRDYCRIIAAYRDLPSRPRIILIAPIRIFRVGGWSFMDLSPETMEERIRPTIRAIAAESGLELVDLVDLFTDPQYCADGVHPQSTGTRLLAEAIYRHIRQYVREKH